MNLQQLRTYIDSIIRFSKAGRTAGFEKSVERFDLCVSV